MASFKVPQTVKNNARRGLALRKKYGRGGLTSQQSGKLGIGSGVQRASNLIQGTVSLSTVKRMSAFFDRHRKNKNTPPEKGNGMISWLLWGGDAGDRWAKSIIKREQRMKKEYSPSIKNRRVYEALIKRGMSKARAARISNALNTNKARLTKTVAGKKLPASSFLVVGDPEKVTTWRLPVRDASGKPERGRMGAAWAALHGGYRGNKYEGPNKRQALSELKRLYAQIGAELPKSKELKASFHVVYKEGKYRWVAISSNAYEDREGEIVSEKALKQSVQRGDCGDLRWWHLSNTKLGTCDFQMVKGKMLIESGTFADERIAKAFAKQKNMQMSIGFSHPPTEPKNGVYENIKIFERSILPRGKAANALTAFQVS